MSERERVLARLRAAASGGRPAPARFVATPRVFDWSAFAAALGAAGGEAHGPASGDALTRGVTERCRAWTRSGRALATPGAYARLGAGPWTPIAPDVDPHSLVDVDVAVVCASLAVAENGAVGLHGADALPRALPLACERLIVLVEVERIESDLHAAFAELGPDAFSAPTFTFVAGPSKTADIEGVLVHGAHGARELAVFGID